MQMIRETKSLKAVRERERERESNTLTNNKIEKIKGEKTYEKRKQRNYIGVNPKK